MKRTELVKRLRQIAKSKGVEMTMTEGGNHTKVRFDREVVTIIARHNEVTERTARASIEAAENWKG